VFHISRLQLFGSYVSAYVMLSVIGMIAGVILSVFLAKSRALPRSFVFRMTTLVLFTGVLAQAFVSSIPRFMLPFSYLLGLFFSIALFLIIGKIFGYNPGDCAELGLISVNTYMIFSRLLPRTSLYGFSFCGLCTRYAFVTSGDTPFPDPTSRGFCSFSSTVFNAFRI